MQQTENSTSLTKENLDKIDSSTSSVTKPKTGIVERSDLATDGKDSDAPPADKDKTS